MQHTIQIGMKESPCLAESAGENVAFDVALSGPLQQRARFDFQVAGCFRSSQPLRCLDVHKIGPSGELWHCEIFA